MAVTQLLREPLAAGEALRPSPAAAPAGPTQARDHCVHAWKIPGRDHFVFVYIPKTLRCLHRVFGEGKREFGRRGRQHAPLTVGFCSRCPHARGAAVRPVGRCCAQCPRVPRRSVWTRCTSPTSAAPSARTVCDVPKAGGRQHAPHGPRTRSSLTSLSTKDTQRCERAHVSPHKVTCMLCDLEAPGDSWEWLCSKAGALSLVSAPCLQT